MAEYVCEWCGITFRDDKHERKFCSSACYESSRGHGVKNEKGEYVKVCRFCGREFTAKTYQTRYCPDCKEHNKMPPVRKKSTLGQDAAEARNHGLSYGKYMARSGRYGN